MTTHYLDITLLPDPEFSQAHLMGALYSKLHRILVQLNSADIGVSFPHYRLEKHSVGHVLRLHGTESALEDLMTESWLTGMRDHTNISAIQAVPAGATQGLVQRRQFKTNVERLRRRRMRRKGETAQEAAAAIPASIERTPKVPYINLRSSSTGQPFSMFIVQSVEPATEQAGSGFNTYGLSAGSRVPFF